jgi:hypothetical protein
MDSVRAAQWPPFAICDEAHCANIAKLPELLKTRLGGYAKLS